LIHILYYLILVMQKMLTFSFCKTDIYDNYLVAYMNEVILITTDNNKALEKFEMSLKNYFKTFTSLKDAKGWALNILYNG